MPYLVADEPNGLWGLVFNGSPLVIARFVLDTAERIIVAAQLREKDGSWSDASDGVLDRLQESILEDNSEAMDMPEDWGMSIHETVPDWAATAVSTPALR